ncbi:multicopper oxidase family protein [Microlunatus flavus]|uniref:Multicopper oxidase with three cupredoxin domains (Includes cell division protein FtsP and spore coat protein CotA) n=1 Tax=Microlunatus flavus TaxID=1036181 RepID=A0A1H9AG45_9ACTN|nr:multicopper oxidase family protein [Microlunatus flavus]SEP75670.1 Multicopper oxidase with three cupredoxin domains (includes cell division protein FtsP and spore coat protein CotA) [Microlunatus flavus]
MEGQTPVVRRRTLVAVLATVLVLAPLGWLWFASLVPERYSVLQMGAADYGGGPGTFAHDHGETAGQPRLSVEQLVADPVRRADVRVDLAAARATLALGAKAVPGFTLNGTSPGPTIRAVQGQLVEVHLRNVDVADGVALHWHGVDVPNAEDGTAGVTQDAVLPGHDHVYRFVAEDAGTYWYHSHQLSAAQVAGGLLGALVVTPRPAVAQQVDALALSHTYGGVRTLNGVAGDQHVVTAPGRSVRLRLVNTDNGLVQVWGSAPYTVLAVDGHDVNRPTPVSGPAYTLTAGGRVDLGLTVPTDGSAVRVQVSKGLAVVVGPDGAPDVAPPPQPTAQVDLLSYGSPAPVGFDPATATRRFRYSIGHRPGFVDGRPGLWWSVNGHLYPNIPMMMVSSGDVVTVHLDNHSGEAHPMHLHGHHAVVLARDGVAATGSPWWFDSLDVADGATYDVAFVADNPGIWMDHCHNLEHAADGMVVHLMYTGVTTPYVIGGPVRNRPE